MVIQIYDIIKIDIGGKDIIMENQGRRKQQIKDNYWILEKAFILLFVIGVFYLIFSLIN